MTLHRLANVVTWNLTCTFGELDISFTPSGTRGYDDLVRTALGVDVRGEQMPVASLADIIRSKKAAGRPKDFRALPALQERLMAQQGTSFQEQAEAMARRAEELPTSGPDGPRSGRPHRPPEQSGPSLG